MIEIDQGRGIIIVDGRELRLDTQEGFDALSDAWIDAAFRAKHVYTFTWLGRPVIQFPDDLLRLQELAWRVQPDVIVETGIAHGGSLIFHASLCTLFGRGRVVGVDIEIRPHNRAAILAHPLAPLITLVEGSSTVPATVRAVKDCIAPGEKVLLVLDSNHGKDHVLAELDAYADLVGTGSYIVAMDGHVMEAAAAAPGAAGDWATNSPKAAVREFAARHPEFAIVEPPFLFSESPLRAPMSGFRGGVLERSG